METNDEHKAMFQQIMTCRAAIVEDMGEKAKTNCGGELLCPICKTGSLRYRCAGAYNGHIHAGCTTEGCVRWME